MERRFIIAALLAFIVLYGWQALFVKPVPRPVAGTGTPQSTQGTVTPPQSGSGVAEIEPATTERSAQPARAAAIVGEAVERDIRIETADVIAVFTNRGARLKSWRLKHYLDARQEPLELVAGELAGVQPLPFSLRVPDKAITATLNDALYALSGPVTEGTTSVQTRLTFEYRNDAGLRAVKEFRIEPSSYLISFHAAVTDGERALAPAIVWGPGLADAVTATSQWDVKPEALFSTAGTVQRIVAADIVKQPSYEQEFDYAGVDDTYFMTIVLRPGRSKLTYEPITIPPAAGSKDPAPVLMSYAIEPGRRDEPLAFYVGPKELEALSAIDRGLVRAIHFGIFSVIVVPLLRTLNWINGFAGNYGWSIVILTVILNIILFPLNHKQIVSMRKMQALQPQVKAIQDRYAKIKATDPAKQKMNQELMALYRERGVNPAMGCVPILLTLPVLIAFYALLTVAIELRGAPFFGWIRDLSQPDPFYVTPILMGAGQLWQQLITPAAGMDPTQQKIMLIMPVMMTFLFLGYPAGVALYWLMSSVLRIGQQYMTNAIIGPPNIPTMRPAAERQLKRVGGGKTQAADASSKG